MKKMLAFSICFLMLFGMFAGLGFAEEGPTGEIAQVESAPEIDGELDEVWAFAKTYEMNNYIVAVPDNEELDPAKEEDDLSGQWRALWDEENVYVLVEMKDNVVAGFNYTERTPGENVSHDDFLVVHIGQGDSHIQANWHVQTKDFANAWLNAPDWTTLDTPDDGKIKHAIKHLDGGYVLEAAIPWEIVSRDGVEAEVGKELRLDIHATDNDFLDNELNEIGVEGRYPQSKHTWSDLINEAHADTKNLGFVTLTEAIEEAVSSTEQILPDVTEDNEDENKEDEDENNDGTNENDNNNENNDDGQKDKEDEKSNTTLFVTIALIVVAVLLVLLLVVRMNKSKK